MRRHPGAEVIRASAGATASRLARLGDLHPSRRAPSPALVGGSDRSAVDPGSDEDPGRQDSGRPRVTDHPPRDRSQDGRSSPKRPSARSSGRRSRRSVNQPIRAPARSSNAGTYGLMSRSGVPSTTSTSSISTVEPRDGNETNRRDADRVRAGRRARREDPVRAVVEEWRDPQSRRRDPVEVVDQGQVAEPLEIGQTLDEGRVEVDPARDTDGRGRLDRHPGRLRERGSDDADRQKGDGLDRSAVSHRTSRVHTSDRGLIAFTSIGDPSRPFAQAADHTSCRRGTRPGARRREQAGEGEDGDFAPAVAAPGRAARSGYVGDAVRLACVGLDHDGGRNPKLARIAWPSGPANQVRNACAAAVFAEALTTTPA